MTGQDPTRTPVRSNYLGLRKAVGAAIRDARGDMPQADLGLLLDVPQTTISRWERGMVDMDVVMVLRIETALGLPGGSILARAGLIAETADRPIEDRLLTDPKIHPDLRSDMVRQYKMMVRTSKAIAGLPA